MHSRRYLISFLSLSFDLKEIHSLFLQFYGAYDEDSNLNFDFQEMVNMFERFSQNDMLGIEAIK